MEQEITGENEKRVLAGDVGVGGFRGAVGDAASGRVGKMRPPEVDSAVFGGLSVAAGRIVLPMFLSGVLPRLFGRVGIRGTLWGRTTRGVTKRAVVVG